MSYALSADCVYDAIYTQMKDYQAEAGLVHAIIGKHQQSRGTRLLNVACGTGLHDQYLARWYIVAGLDLSPEMLAVAARRNPGLSYSQGSMVDFDLGETYDAVTCLFSAIGHIGPDELNATIATMAQHLAPGGVMVIEPWIRPHMWHDGHLSIITVDKPDLKISRITTSTRCGNVTSLTMHHMVGTRDRVDYFAEHHQTVMFTEAEFAAAFRVAGLTAWFDESGLSNNGRGVYIASKELA